MLWNLVFIGLEAKIPSCVTDSPVEQHNWKFSIDTVHTGASINFLSFSVLRPTVKRCESARQK